MGNVTFPVTIQDGRSVRAGFEFAPFHAGARHLCYKGKLTYTDHYPSPEDEFCVVKADKLAPVATETGWEDVLARARITEDIVRKFNQIVGFQVEAVTPSVAACDEVSAVGSTLFGRGSRCIEEGELLLVTHYLEHVQTFGHNYHHPMLQSLSHFSWHITNGQALLCDFQGQETGKGYKLLTPTVFSKGRKFGAKDMGQDGINKIFSRHLCTNICQYLNDPRNT